MIVGTINLYFLGTDKSMNHLRVIDALIGLTAFRIQSILNRGHFRSHQRSSVLEYALLLGSKVSRALDLGNSVDDRIVNLVVVVELHVRRVALVRLGVLIIDDYKATCTLSVRPSNLPAAVLAVLSLPFAVQLASLKDTICLSPTFKLIEVEYFFQLIG